MATKHLFLKDFSQSFVIHPQVKRSNPDGKDTRSTVAVLTSGGDAPGMNPAIRTIVRGVLNRGGRIFAIRDGYLGLCRGDETDFKEMNWNDVGGIIHLGGTCLGTARCDEFRSFEGRKRVTYNLISRGINRLVVVGGDGSLTGAQVLWKEWKGYVEQILEEMKAAEDKQPYAWYERYWVDREEEIKSFHVVGLVGSIDNDMGDTSMTIGCDSALERICSAIDNLSSTASSHQRDFIIEVMGRKCGWLALKAAVACGADFVFIPENPVPDDWPELLIKNLTLGRQHKRSSIIVVAEGAQDQNLQPITSDQVKKAIDACGIESRVTILGHVQRGGPPSFYDRAHSMLLGHNAAKVILSDEARDQPQLICVEGLFNTVTRPVSACLETCKRIEIAIAKKNFDAAMGLRGNDFVRAYNALKYLFRANCTESIQGSHRICLLHIGACAPGMNTMVRAVVRISIARGLSCFAAIDGLDGLQNGNIVPMSWMDVNGWSPLGGAKLGTSRYNPEDMDIGKIIESLQKFSINTIVMMGGWDGYLCMTQLQKKVAEYPALANVNIMLVPCTISNNIPGTQSSIGSDTALNCIVDAVDKIKQSAIAHKRIFVIEVMGAYCGFLACMSAFATGAEKAYLNESNITLKTLQEDVQNVRESFENHKTMALIFTTENSSKTFDTKFFTKLFRGIAADEYDVRMSILGHLQQGGPPTAIDRFMAVEMAYELVSRIHAINESKRSGVVESIAINDGVYSFLTPEQFVPQMDLKNRRPVQQWWFPTLYDISREYGDWEEHPDRYSKPGGR